MINEFIVKRQYKDNCTVGELYFKEQLICFTLEKPWKNNIAFNSCISPGKYALNKYRSNKFKNAFSLQNLDLGVSLNSNTQRTHILIHIANTVEEVNGCIALGLGKKVSTYGVAELYLTSSKLAFNKVNSIFSENPGEWIITISI